VKELEGSPARLWNAVDGHHSESFMEGSREEALLFEDIAKRPETEELHETLHTILNRGNMENNNNSPGHPSRS